MQYQQGTSKRCSKWQDQIQIVNLILKVIIVELMRSQALIHLRLIRVALCTRINVQHQERDVLEQDLEVLQVLQDVVLQMENELETLQKATTDEECSRWKARQKINGGQLKQMREQLLLGVYQKYQIAIVKKLRQQHLIALQKNLMIPLNT
ncbi:unnamed protein product [Paramecium pentaurelia]|uniref:Uncharacterized protein n=1 Tax=Paramecium pentaurelia TaxID=43138 RepID=A0A8S1WX74_9CILI|nr:unnamed protein product [Paramecium pentaurelia]